ncbi:hypothetical protein ACQB60_05995 [Actinomycetota bacterium Odt1-20B]
MNPHTDDAPRAQRTSPRARKAVLGFVAAALSVGATLGGTAGAQAEPTPTHKGPHCYDGPANCVLTKYHPRKGTVRVTVNNVGHSPYLYGGDVRHRGKIKCTFEVRDKWKKKTFKCKNMPKGKLRLAMPYGKSTHISMKW